MGKDVLGVSEEALDMLCQYSWPGNVRELQSVLRQALVHSVGSMLLPDFLPSLVDKAVEELPLAGSAEEGIEELGRFGQFIEASLQSGTDNLYEEALRRMERLLLTRVLQLTAGNQLQAAKILGITRGSLRTKLRDLGITISRSVANEESKSDPHP
jgi:two-component system nitrogen regulation response regulator GlnG